MIAANKIQSQLAPRIQGRTCCITGGAGFIGSHLARTILDLGGTVHIIDDLSSADPTAVTQLVEHSQGRATFTYGSILDPAALDQAIEGATTIFHLAAMASVPQSIAEPQRAMAVNAMGTARVAEAARTANASRIIYAASSSAYGDTRNSPKQEDQAPSPQSPYAVSKLTGEHILRAWWHSYKLDAASLRFFNVFGPGQPANSAYAAAIPLFIKDLSQGNPARIFGDGNQTRDFIHVANAVYAMLLAATADGKLMGESMNIASGTATTINDLADRIAQDLGVTTPPNHLAERPGDIRHSLADITRARQLIGYQPIVDLQEGLADTIAPARAAQPTS